MMTDAVIVRSGSDRSSELDLEALRAEIWLELQHAADDRKHEWRTPVLAGVDANGLPQARTVVLRGCDPVANALVVYTDSRSPKVGELLARPDAVLVFWSGRLNWQLRARVKVQVFTAGEAVEDAWNQVSTTAAAADYLAPAAPGSDFETQSSGRSAAHHLAVLLARVQSFDWLALSREGHRRVRFDDSCATRLVP
jgi:hypothetical protein